MFERSSCTHTNSSTPTRTLGRACTRMDAHMRACALAPKRPCTRARTHARSHARTHARTYVRMHARARSSSRDGDAVMQLRFDEDQNTDLVWRREGVRSHVHAHVRANCCRQVHAIRRMLLQVHMLACAHTCVQTIKSTRAACWCAAKFGQLDLANQMC